MSKQKYVKKIIVDIVGDVDIINDETVVIVNEDIYPLSMIIETMIGKQITLKIEENEE